MALSVSCPFLLSRIALIYKLIFLVSVSGVATTWNLSLNEEKCYAFHFYSRLSFASFIYQLNGQQISSKGEGKDLGLTIAADFATKFITNYTPIDYRDRLIHLNLLPLMMELEIADVMFLVKSLKFPSNHFNICDNLQFCSRPTRACHNLKLKHSLCRSNLERSFYFNRIPRLWNSLPPLSLHLSLSTIKSKLQRYFWDQF